MKFFGTKKQKKLYIRFFLVLTVLTFVMIILLTFILTKRFEGMVQKKIYDETLYSLNQSSQFSTVVADTVARLTYQIYIDKSVSRLLYSPLLDVFEIQPLLQHLVNYSTVMPFLDSVYVYNQPCGYVFVGSSYQNQMQLIEEFADKNFLSLIRVPYSDKILNPIPRKAHIVTPREFQKSFYTFYYYDWLNEKSSIRMAVAVNLSASWLNSVTTTVDQSMDASTIIVDRDGMVVSDDSSYPMCSDVSEVGSLQAAMQSQSNGYVIDTINGSKMFIAYTAYNGLGWKYIKMIPYIYVKKEINQIRFNSAIIAVVILLAGFIFSLIASKKLYQPIEALSINLLKLEDEKNKNMDKLRKAFLDDFFHNRIEYGFDEIQSIFKQYSIQSHPGGTYYLALLKVDGFKSFLEKYSHAEQKEMLLGINEISVEHCSKCFNIEAMQMDNHDICLIMNKRDESATIDNGFFVDIFSRIQASVQKYYSVSLSITISEPGKTIFSIHDLYEQSLRASLHRVFLGRGSIIFVNSIMKLNENRYQYPEAKEKKLVDYIMSGNLEEAKHLYLEIIDETPNYSILVLNLVVSRLAYIIHELLRRIQKDSGIESKPTDSWLFIEVSSYESLEEINRFFFDMLDEHAILLKYKKSTKFIEIVSKIENFVQENYYDAMLSIDRIADTLKLSTAHIERIYKHQTRKTIHDLITEKRMKKAQELLVKTNLSIWRIAQSVGYNSNSYFCISFKKKHGITPAEYRKRPSISIPSG